MIGSDRTRPRASAPLGLLGMLALMAIVEGAFARNRVDLVVPYQLSGQLSRYYAGLGAPRREVLCLGDSMVKHGVLPTALERRSGLKGYNFAVDGAQPPVSYYLLRRAIASGSRPKAVVVDFFPRLLRVDPWFFPEGWPFELGIGDAADLAWSERDASLFAWIATRQLLPSLASRTGLNFEVTYALKGQPWFWAIRTRPARETWRKCDGGEPLPPNPAYTLDVAASLNELLPSWSPRPSHLEYVRRFLDLAAEHRIAVFVVAPPIMPGLQAASEANGVDAAYTSFLRRLEETYPGVVVVDGRHAGYPAPAFNDANHLGSIAAESFSEALGEVLRRHLAEPAASPRWVDLTPTALAGLVAAPVRR